MSGVKKSAGSHILFFRMRPFKKIKLVKSVKVRRKVLIKSGVAGSKNLFMVINPPPPISINRILRGIPRIPDVHKQSGLGFPMM